MRAGRTVIVTLGFVLLAAIPARADDAPTARAVVDRAIKAHGGAEALAKLTASTTVFKGKFHGMGEAIDMTGEVSTQGGDLLKIDVEVEAGGMKFRFISILNKDKGWIKMGDNTVEMDKDQIAEAQHGAYTALVTTLTPLADKAYTLDTVGESKVDDKTVIGIRVSRKDRRDVTLFFDKETGMLIKFETRVKDEMSGQEVTEETILSDYKDVQGTKQSMKFTAKRDGKLFIVGEATDFTLAEKHDPSLYDKPGS